MAPVVALSPGARLGWALAYALATLMCFPQLLAGRVVDFGWGLAWVSPALLILAIRGLAPAAAARWAFGASLVAHAGVLHWIYVVSVEYGHAHPVVGVLAPVLLASYVAGFTAAFAALFAWWSERGLGSPPAAAVAWTALDYLRSFLFTGFPWATLGYAQHQNAALMELAAWTGVYGLCFVSVLGGAALASLYRCWREPEASEHAAAGSRAARSRLGVALASLAAVALVLLVGAVSARRPEAPGSERVRVGVIQGSIEQGVKWSPDWREQSLARYEALSRQAAAEGARLLVWPETAVPGALERDASLRARLLSLARELDVALVVGGVGVSPELEHSGLRYYDSAFVVEPQGELGERYDKTHLVPFGEYLPFRALLGGFLGALARGIAPDDVSAGAAPRSVEVPLADGSRIRVGIPICYELLFPDLVRRFANSGASLLLAVTNDAWYGRTGAPYQFLAITALRAAETRLATARAANTGVSAFIDARGRVREPTPIFEPTYRVSDMRVRGSQRSSSFYARHGDVFVQVCWLVVALWAARAWRAGMSDAPVPSPP